MNKESARKFGEEWIAASNGHDINRVLSYYTDDFEMQSPGIIFNCNGTLIYLLVAWYTARTGTFLRGSKPTERLNRCIGGFFIYLGIRLAFDERV